MLLRFAGIDVWVYYQQTFIQFAAICITVVFYIYQNIPYENTTGYCLLLLFAAVVCARKSG
jgi:hypothetical protein